MGVPASSLDETNQLDGYNIAFAHEIASRLELAARLDPTLFEQLIAAVQGHDCDISVS